tara:strand:+ start:796 stop:1908 length:1113 start_codon:yes stop_codon:yes gene_type:complete
MDQQNLSNYEMKEKAEQDIENDILHQDITGNNSISCLELLKIASLNDGNIFEDLTNKEIISGNNNCSYIKLFWKGQKKKYTSTNRPIKSELQCVGFIRYVGAYEPDEKIKFKLSITENKYTDIVDIVKNIYRENLSKKEEHKKNKIINKKAYQIYKYMLITIKAMDLINNNIENIISMFMNNRNTYNLNIKGKKPIIYGIKKVREIENNNSTENIDTYNFNLNAYNKENSNYYLRFGYEWDNKWKAKIIDSDLRKNSTTYLKNNPKHEAKIDDEYLTFKNFKKFLTNNSYISFKLGFELTKYSSNKFSTRSDINELIVKRLENTYQMNNIIENKKINDIMGLDDLDSDEDTNEDVNNLKDDFLSEDESED